METLWLLSSMWIVLPSGAKHDHKRKVDFLGDMETVEYQNALCPLANHTNYIQKPHPPLPQKGMTKVYEKPTLSRIGFWAGNLLHINIFMDFDADLEQCHILRNSHGLRCIEDLNS
uniref:Uncharacterized protein n=1 Tax=Sphaerodactylus townsendi TaxID=933632 RepID=A0ACB8G5Q8_9SAUR